jgi:hypothetical protein
MSNRILTVLEKVCKFKDVFELDVKHGRYHVSFKTPNDRRHSYQFKDDTDSELLALERDVAKIEYDNGSQRVKDKKILNSFVQQYHELRLKFPDVKVYGLESACGARVIAEIDHGYGCRVMSKIED